MRYWGPTVLTYSLKLQIAYIIPFNPYHPQDNLFYALLVVMCTGVVVQGFGALGLYSCLTKKWAPNVAVSLTLTTL